MSKWRLDTRRLGPSQRHCIYLKRRIKSLSKNSSEMIMRTERDGEASITISGIERTRVEVVG